MIHENETDHVDEIDKSEITVEAFDDIWNKYEKDIPIQLDKGHYYIILFKMGSLQVRAGIKVSPRVKITASLLVIDPKQTYVSDRIVLNQTYRGDENLDIFGLSEMKTKIKDGQNLQEVCAEYLLAAKKHLLEQHQ
ncbi:MAG: hypothetical protein NT135_01825 [Candidatus Berkelbacteria bacterium]|nr:hypothetical protein [Candidatus Berkelbacteria bacterium]